MCGIAGIIHHRNIGPVNRDLLIDMISIQRYRGPDESGIYVDQHAGLGHVRLSIIGVGGGGQPICNEDETLWIVYNGEAFNYVELKEELLSKGHVFTTQTDTEVLLHLYEEHGPAFLERINGQFSIAIWDSRRKKLFIARDRVGIRPVYYFDDGNRFLFASEIKAIMQDPSVPKEFDQKAIAQVFTFWSTVTPMSIFKGVRELPAGHHLTVCDGKVELKEYWRFPYYPTEERWQGSLPEAVDALRSLLLDAVRVRLRADVPVGAYLSGGLDSSIITSIISNNFNNHLRTFSISFQEATYDETDFQKELVSKLKTEHCQVTVSNSLIREKFPDVIWHCEIPLLRTGPVPMFVLSALVRSSNFKVVLSGEGADEVFGGYNIFKEAKIRHFFGRMPESRWRSRLVERLYPYIFKNPARNRIFLQKFFAVNTLDLGSSLFSHSIRWEQSWKNSLFFSKDLFDGLSGYRPLDEITPNIPPDFPSWDVLAKAQYLESTIFLSNYLLSSQGDRVGMANSIEMRHPFLDYRVIDFAARLPAKWKIRGLNEKYILKKSFGAELPSCITRRPKQPYRAPISQVFFAKDCKVDYVDELLSERKLSQYGYFDVEKVTHLIRKFRTAPDPITNEFQNMAVTGILSTQLLHHQYLAEWKNRTVERIVPDKVVVKI